MILQQHDKQKALYTRWSRDEGFETESSSIESQKALLEDYARTHGYYNVAHYSDDGLKGTNFNRQEFNRMLKDIEAGKIDTVIIKDLSRLGRNYLEAGHYTDNYFPDKNVRVIALGDGYDSAQGENDFVPFKHIINEWYVKDLSKKVKAGYRAKALKGQYTGAYAPYGYQKDPLNKHKLIIDEETAPVVKLIFELAAKNYSLYRISKKLESMNILRPRTKQAQEGKYRMKGVLKYPNEWGRTTIKQIINNKAYIGHLVAGRKASKSYKDNKLIDVPQEKWIITENTHEPIIDNHTFELAQKIIQVKGDGIAYADRARKENVFKGILYCADCGYTLTNYVKGDVSQYACGTYRMYGKARCSMHYIRGSVLNDIVLREIQHCAEMAALDENKLLDLVFDSKQNTLVEEKRQKEKQETKLNKRLQELDILIQRVFEEKVLGNITDERASILIDTYETERNKLKDTLWKLKNEIASYKDTKANAEQFIKIIRKYTNIQTLTHEIVIELIDKIVIHEREWSDGQEHVGCRENRHLRTQQIDIYFRLIGKI